MCHTMFLVAYLSLNVSVMVPLAAMASQMLCTLIDHLSVADSNPCTFLFITTFASPTTSLPPIFEIYGLNSDMVVDKKGGLLQKLSLFRFQSPALYFCVKQY